MKMMQFNCNSAVLMLLFFCILLSLEVIQDMFFGIVEIHHIKIDCSLEILPYCTYALVLFHVSFSAI